LVETARQLRARFGRSELGNFTATIIQQRKSSNAWLLEIRRQ